MCYIVINIVINVVTGINQESGRRNYGTNGFMRS